MNDIFPGSFAHESATMAVAISLAHCIALAPRGPVRTLDTQRLLAFAAYATPNNRAVLRAIIGLPTLES